MVERCDWLEIRHVLGDWSARRIEINKTHVFEYNTQVVYIRDEISILLVDFSLICILRQSY